MAAGSTVLPPPCEYGWVCSSTSWESMSSRSISSMADQPIWVACRAMTAFGNPVVPPVNRMFSSSSGSTTGRVPARGTGDLGDVGGAGHPVADDVAHRRRGQPHRSGVLLVAGGGQQRVGLDARHQAGDLIGCEPRVQRHPDQPGQRQRELRHHAVHAVGPQVGHPVARPQPEIGQAHGELVCLSVQLRPGQAVAAGDDGRPGAVQPGGALQVPAEVQNLHPTLPVRGPH